MRAIIFLLYSLMVMSVSAEPFPKGDPAAGKTLADKSCSACHVSLYGGDGSKIYTRPDHKIKTAQQLLSQVRTCNTNAGANFFPEDEEHVAAYLNSKYYKFK